MLTWKYTTISIILVIVSDSEGLFSFTDFDDIKDWDGDPCHYVHIHKVKF